MDVLNSVSLSYKKLVIGNSLEALYFAYCHSLPIVCNRTLVPFPFEFFPKDFNTLLHFNVPDVRFELKSNIGMVQYGNRKVHVYDRLYYLLSIAGKNPFAGQEISNIRLVGNNELLVYIGMARAYSVFFKQAYVFYDKSLEGFELEGSKSARAETFLVLDWLNVRSCGPHKFDLLMDSKERFVKRIYFFPSVRIDGAANGRYKDRVHKDLVTISYLSRADLDKPEYSEIYVKFIVLKMMADNGIVGNVKEYQENEIISRPIKLDLDEREIRSLSRFTLKPKRNLKVEEAPIEEMVKKYNCIGCEMDILNRKLFPELKAKKWRYLKYQM